MAPIEKVQFLPNTVNKGFLKNVLKEKKAFIPGYHNEEKVFQE